MKEAVSFRSPINGALVAPLGFSPRRKRLGYRNSHDQIRSLPAFCQVTRRCAQLSYHFVEIGESAPRLRAASARANAFKTSLKFDWLVCRHASENAAITCGMYELILTKSRIRIAITAKRVMQV